MTTLRTKIIIIVYISIAIFGFAFLAMEQFIKATLAILILGATPIFLKDPRYLFLMWILTSPFVNRFLDPGLASSDNVVGSANVRELLNYDRIVIILLVLIAVSSRKYRDREISSMTSKYMGIFSAVVILSCLTASFNKFHCMRVAIDAFIVPFLSFYLGMKYSEDSNFMRKVFITILILGIYISLSGVVELVMSGNIYHRASGPFPYWETFGLLQVCTFFIAVYSIITKIGNKKLGTLCLIFSLVGIALTFTRTIWMSVLVSILMVFLMAKDVQAVRSYFKKLFLTLFVGIVALSLMVSLRPLEMRVGTQDTVENRLETFKFAWRLFKSSPILGVGFKNFRSLYGEEEIEFETKYSRRGTSELHSGYLAILCELGIAGLLVFLSIFWNIFREGRSLLRARRSDENKLYVMLTMGVAVTTLLSGVSFNPFYDSFMVGKLQFFIIGTMFYENSSMLSELKPSQQINKNKKT